jgi:hypothetical protein
MPSLVANYQKKQIVTQLQKTFSVISQANATAVAELGQVDSLPITATRPEVIAHYEKYLFPYLKTVKICTTSSRDCGVEKYTFLNGTNDSVSSNTNNKLHCSQTGLR